MLLMEEILHQLIGSISVYPIIFGALCIVGGAGFLPSTVSPAKKMEPEEYTFGKGETCTKHGFFGFHVCFCGCTKIFCLLYLPMVMHLLVFANKC